MKAHKLFKKAVAGVLSLALALGLAPSMLSTGQAYAGTASEPSVSVYADKKALTDDTFAPQLDESGTAVTNENNVGKINFGGKSWYLLGGSGDNNVDVFVAEELATRVKFNSNFNPAEFTPAETSEPWSSVDYGTGVTKPTTVYVNNYGASDLRKTLQNYAANSTNFNSVEQGMMNPIEVTTTDTKNNQTYTTADKLYAAAEGSGAYTGGGATIDVNGKKLPMSTYWSESDKYFWLRSPSSQNTGQEALYCSGGSMVSTGGAVNDNYAVRPAANLDMSNVLFASAAPAATLATKGAKTTFTSDVMNLRLEAKDSGATVTKSQLGDVTVNASAGTIVATIGNAGTVTLMVQGNDGTDNWYYAKDLTSRDTTVKASDIGNDVDLSKCKVWLETTGTDGMIYATNAATDEVIKLPAGESITGSGSGQTIINSGEKEITVTPNTLDGKDTIEVPANGKVKIGDKEYEAGDEGVTLEVDKDGNVTVIAGSLKNDDSNKDKDKDNNDSADDTVKTGDDANILGLLALMALAAAGAGTVFVRRRQN